MQIRNDIEGLHITVSNSANLSSVYIRLFRHRKKVFYCLNIAFLEKYGYFAVYKQFICKRYVSQCIRKCAEFTRISAAALFSPKIRR